MNQRKSKTLNESLDDDTRITIRLLGKCLGWGIPKCTAFFGATPTLMSAFSDLGKEIKSLRETPADDADHETRLKAAKADLAEIERDAQRGLLVLVDERNENEAQRIGLMRSRILGLPDQLRLSAGLTIPQAETCERVLRHALEALADELEGMDNGSEN